MISFCLNNPKWVTNNPTSMGIFNFFGDQTPELKKKYSVKFAEVCRVVLVPKREEYHAAGIKLWWSSSDFNQFKRVGGSHHHLYSLINYCKQDRYAELTAEHESRSSLSSTDTALGPPSLSSPSPSPSSSLSSSPKEFKSCYLLNLNVLVCTAQSPMKCQILSNFSKYVWSDDNPDRHGTSVCVSYTTHEKALANIDGNDPHRLSLEEFNIIILDNTSTSAMRGSYTNPLPANAVAPCPTQIATIVTTADTSLNLSKQTPILPPSSNRSLTCELIRRLSPHAVIICIMEDEATIQSNDDSSVDQADLLLPFPEIPSCDHWKQLIDLFILRKENGDFLPSPLIQQYITAL